MNQTLPLPPEFFVDALRRLGHHLRAAVMHHRQGMRPEDLIHMAVEDGEGDTIYPIDRASEEALVRFVESEIAPRCPCWLIAEGISGEGMPLGGAERRRPEETVRLIVDPIDGTRGILFDKRSAWVLAAVAPNRGSGTTLADIVVAAQTELPTTRQWRADQLWAVRGQGAFGVWENMLGSESGALSLHPSRATGLEHGFASFARFFPGARDVIAEVEEEVMRRVAGPFAPGRAIIFEDQYISTGGQLYELIVGHDRLVADVRPLTRGILRDRGLAPMLATHPYDLACALIAEEAGVVVTDATGARVAFPLDTDTECAWIGYANESIRARVEPVLQAVLREKKLM